MANPTSQSAPRPSESAGRPLGAATVDEGVKLASAGRLDAARACFERVLAANPGNADASNNLGVVHMQTGNVGAAIEMFERAHSANPLDRQIRNNLIQATDGFAQALTLQKRHREAIVFYRRVLALDPDNIGARINLTNTLARTGTHAERSDFVADGNARIGCHALVACMPKSGSSLLFEALHHLTG